MAATRSPAACLPVCLLGTGAALPDAVVAAATLDRRLGLPPGTVERRHGVARRHVARADERASTLGARAARAALDAAGLEPARLDLILSACSVMEQAIPCQAALIQRALGLGASGTPAFDVNASCLSFLAALDVAAAAIALGRHRRVLIVSSEIPSVGIDEDDAATSGLFGDGAAAVVLAHPDAPEARRVGARDAALLAFEMATWSDGADCCALPGGGTANRPDRGLDDYLEAMTFRMDGKRLYRAVARHFPPFLARLLERAGVGVEELSLVVPHQASGRALAELAARLALPRERIVETLGSHGNLVAASIPFALDHAIAAGRLRRGDLVALLGTGAGLSLGGAVLRY